MKGAWYLTLIVIILWAWIQPEDVGQWLGTIYVSGFDTVLKGMF